MTRRLTVLALLLATMLAWASPLVLAVEYFVDDATGDDGHTCGDAQSAGTPKQSVLAGLACAGPSGDVESGTQGAGDIVTVAPGTYVEEIFGQMPGGSSGNPFTLRCSSITYPTEPVCKLAPTTGACTGGKPCHGITAEWSGHVVVDGFKVDAGENTNQGLNIYGTNFTFKRGWVVNAFFSGVYSEGNNGLYEDVKFTLNGTRNSSYIPAGGGPNDIYIPGNNNTFRRIWLVDGSAGLAFWHDTLTPTGNILEDSVIQPGLSGVSGRTTTGGAGVYKGTNHIRNTVLDRVGIWVQFGCTDCTVENVTQYNHQALEGYGVLVDATAVDTVIRNSILCNNATGAVSDGGTGTQEITNLETCPAFVDAGAGNFNLVGQDNGGTFNPALTVDMAGRVRDNPPDRGALEFVSLDGNLSLRRLQGIPGMRMLRHGRSGW